MQLTQQSISGKSTEVLQTLCFQVECPDEKTAQNLADFLSAVNWQTIIAVIPWNRADFLKEQDLIDSSPSSFSAMEGLILPDDGKTACIPWIFPKGFPCGALS